MATGQTSGCLRSATKGFHPCWLYAGRTHHRGSRTASSEKVTKGVIRGHIRSRHQGPTWFILAPRLGVNTALKVLCYVGVGWTTKRNIYENEEEIEP